MPANALQHAEIEAVDILHLIRSGGLPADLAKMAPRLWGYIHICYGPLDLPVDVPTTPTPVHFGLAVRRPDETRKSEMRSFEAQQRKRWNA